GHISLYQLTIEPGTAFFRQQVRETEEDLAADLYELTQQMCEDAGMPAYEISNHAALGQESRHNLTYWTGGDYIGVGPGAHGRLSSAVQTPCQTRAQTRAVYQMADPARWLAAVEAKGHATAKVRPLSGIERIEEVVLSGLRLRHGLEAKQFHRMTGQDLLTALNIVALVELQEAGLVVLDDQGLRTTPRGRLMLNTILHRLLDDADEEEDTDRLSKALI
ncbi:MAG: coproporphyrinogen III oxidase, partial [Magnetovibrio sp.]|nr:coproporphyrinogen III oxidase [Magnetovibrio sp.]